MEVKEALLCRRSVRKYTETPEPRDQFKEKNVHYIR